MRRTLGLISFIILFRLASVPLHAGQLDILGPTGSGTFGASVTVLPNGNFVVTDPTYSIPDSTANVGAVYLYNSEGELLSTLRGSTANDSVGSGGVVVLSNGNYVIISPKWNRSFIPTAGAVTWGNATSGRAGVVSPANSLVGSSEGDSIGSLGVKALTNGNYVVVSPSYGIVSADPAVDSILEIGAVTWGNGTTGLTGTVSSLNSLVGSTTGDKIGSFGVTELRNGHYVVCSPNWENDGTPRAGAVTWGNGTTGISGAVSASNSLVGTSFSDNVGSNGVLLFANGNYIISTAGWNNGAVADVGAITFANGSSGISGPISATNSLVGTTSNDKIGSGGVIVLANGSYVVSSPKWDRGSIVDAGAATFANGTTGISGAITATNSLVGSTTADQVSSSGIIPLASGHYAVSSPNWDNESIVDAGAATFANGATGLSGAITATNSLVGGTLSDRVSSGGVVLLGSGNYIVSSPNWDKPAVVTPSATAIVDAGAATFANGATGLSGTISATNSLIGGTLSDQVSSGGVTALTSGSYIVSSPKWDKPAVVTPAATAIIDAGGVTLGDGSIGVYDLLTETNSLLGATAGDSVSSGGVTELNNENFVISSPTWGKDKVLSVGAVTLWKADTALVGKVSATNSLIGNIANDKVGSGGIVRLTTNDNYIVVSPLCDAGAVVDAGAVTWCNGSTGLIDKVSETNSLLGSAIKDNVGNGGITVLSSGNYVVNSPNWDYLTLGDAGAVTWCDGTIGRAGKISVTNSLIGSLAQDTIGGTSNSSATRFGVKAFSDNNFVVLSPDRHAVAGSKTGAISLGKSTTVGFVRLENSVLGAVAYPVESMVYDYDVNRSQLIVGQPLSKLVSLFSDSIAPLIAYIKGPIVPVPATTFDVGQTVTFSVDITPATGNTFNYSWNFIRVSTYLPTTTLTPVTTPAATITHVFSPGDTYKITFSTDGFVTQRTLLITVNDNQVYDLDGNLISDSNGDGVPDILADALGKDPADTIPDSNPVTQDLQGTLTIVVAPSITYINTKKSAKILRSSSRALPTSTPPTARISFIARFDVTHDTVVAGKEISVIVGDGRMVTEKEVERQTLQIGQGFQIGGNSGEKSGKFVPVPKTSAPKPILNKGTTDQIVIGRDKTKEDILGQSAKMRLTIAKTIKSKGTKTLTIVVSLDKTNDAQIVLTDLTPLAVIFDGVLYWGKK